jgi:hypothetical protein
MVTTTCIEISNFHAPKLNIRCHMFTSVCGEKPPLSLLCEILVARPLHWHLELGPRQLNIDHSST